MPAAGDDDERVELLLVWTCQTSPLLCHWNELPLSMQAPSGYVNLPAGRSTKQPHTRKRSRLFSTAATDIFGKASMDPYSFGV